MAILELSLISATLSSDVQLDPDPKDIYATVKFGNEQRCTKIACGHGRSPVWNETLTFNLDNDNFPKFIFVQLFAVRSDADELLGVARIQVPTSGEIEGSLHVLVSASKGETGTLKAAGGWMSTSQPGESFSSFATGDDMASNRRNDIHASYPPTLSTYHDVTSAFSNLAVGKGQGKEWQPSPAYPPVAYPPQNKGGEGSAPSSSPYPPAFDVSKCSYPSDGKGQEKEPYPSPVYPPVAYPPQNKGEEWSTPSSSPYSRAFDVSNCSYPPDGKGQDKEPYPSSAYPPVAYPPQNEGEEWSPPSSSPYPPPFNVSKDSYPLNPYPLQPGTNLTHPDYEESSSLSERSHISTEEGKESSHTITRGLGDTVDKGLHSHMPYGYPPPAMYGGGYPPPLGYPPQYGPPPGGYPPPPAYPPAQHGMPPSPYGYPPGSHPYQQSQPYSPYGYPPQAPYPIHPGHGSYTPGMYVGHSSSGKHSKHYKHNKMKMPKHSMYNYGHPQPHYPMHGHHYKHKKNKMFGKGHKFKKFKGFKKFKF